ncbi:MAG: helix-turn-helix domain-containing protein [Anaerolineae bacterium]
MSLGSAIRSLRKKKGWTQEQLSAYASVGRSYISMLENDVRPNVSARILARLSSALGVTTDYLMQQAGTLPSPEEIYDPLLQEIITHWRHLPSWKRQDLAMQAGLIFEQEQAERLRREGVPHEEEKVGEREQETAHAGPG